MMEIIKTEDPNFVRDKRSTAILNIDKAGYTQFKMERERALQAQRTAQEVATLQQDMNEIKQLLQQLINGKTNGTSDI